MAKTGTKGRPTKYSPQIVRNLCKWIQEGNTLKNACAMERIHYDTFNEWRTQFPDFSVAIEHHEALCKAACIARITAAGYDPKTKKGDWRADLALLNRRFPQEPSMHASHSEYRALEQGVENATKIVD